MKNETIFRAMFPFLILIVMILGCGGQRNKQQAAANEPLASPTASPAKTPSPNAPKPAEPKPEQTTGVNMANFQRLKTGMSYSEVVRILGSEGEVLSENNIGGVHTIMYQWKGGVMANMNAMFQNGKMVSKAQFGLE